MSAWGRFMFGFGECSLLYAIFVPYFFATNFVVGAISLMLLIAGSALSVWFLKFFIQEINPFPVKLLNVRRIRAIPYAQVALLIIGVTLILFHVPSWVILVMLLSYTLPGYSYGRFHFWMFCLGYHFYKGTFGQSQWSNFVSDSKGIEEKKTIQLVDLDHTARWYIEKR